MSEQTKLELCLHGAFSCRWDNGTALHLTGAKTRGLVAMLAVAANGVHSRKWIQEHLWGRSGVELGRQSLRRVLSDMRKTFSDDFDRVFSITNIDIELKLENVVVVSKPSDGIFLAGIGIPEPVFQKWLGQIRETGQPGGLQFDTDKRLSISPSIAVLPFIAVSGASSETHFGDLIAMDVARALSRSRFLDVISHLSSRQLGPKVLDLRALKSKLNADYAISGHVRINGDHYRLDADFIQTSTGRILWTEEFQGKVADILAGGSELVARVARQCGQEILRASVEIARSAPLPEVAAHALFMSSISEMHQHHLASFASSRVNLEELVSRMPGFSVLHAWLAKWYILSISQGWSTDVSKDSAIASDHTARALDINPNCPTALTIDGMVQGDRSDDMSIPMARFDAAIENDPNQSMAWLMYSRLNSYLGNGDMAVEFANKAMRLSPIGPHGYLYNIMGAMAHSVRGEMDIANKLAERSLRQNPRHISSYRVLVITQHLSGQEAKAKETAKILMRLEPTLTIEKYLRSHPAGQMNTGKTWANVLKEVGIPKQ